jgi:AAA+ superfamily predicted ATPase
MTGVSSNDGPAQDGDIQSELDNLIGLTEVKQKISELRRIVEVKGKDFLPCLHMVFRGNPGTGKTTVARIIGKIFAQYGLLKSKDIFVETDRGGLIGEHIGETALKTTSQINKAIGGVLFIDEAYMLVYSDFEGDFGHECIATLVKRLEDNCKDFVCIMAGYTDEMDYMLKSNPGLRDRMQFYIDFPDYSVEELVQIFNDLSAKSRLTLEAEAEKSLFLLFTNIVIHKDKNFSNARMVRKIFERVQIQSILRSDDNKILAIDIDSACQSNDIKQIINGPTKTSIGFTMNY